MFFLGFENLLKKGLHKTMPCFHQNVYVPKTREEALAPCDFHLSLPASIALSSLTEREKEELTTYVQNNRTRWTLAAKAKKEAIYLSSKETGLPRSLHFTPEGRVFAHLNKKTPKPNRGVDQLLGKGGFKIVTMAVDLDTGERFASAATAKVQGDKEVKELAPFKGKKGFLQVKERVDYISSKRGRAKTRLLFPLAYEGQEFRGSLRETITSLKEEEVPVLFEKLLRVLKTMHEQGIAHKDLHSGNILIYGKGEDIEPVIIDFGLSGKAKKGDISTKNDLYDVRRQFMMAKCCHIHQKAHLGEVKLGREFDSMKERFYT